MQSRAYWLMNLLNLSYPLEQIMPQLRLYPWDSQEALGVFEINHLVQILERYVHGELLANEVEAWANAIEGREDIDYEKGFEHLIEEAIFRLANPLLTAPLSQETAHELQQGLYQG